MSIVIQNALLADIDPIGVQRGSLRIERGRIVQRGVDVSVEHDDEVVDCGGSVVLPGLVNGHTHLYAALAVGMPPPPRVPENFLEILKHVWWRLDQAHDRESIETSARIGAIEALRCGTTTLIDHHASPGCIDGSLDRVEAGIATVGLRAVLCYETTDRHGADGRELGIEENRRYLQKCAERRDECFSGMVGAHAMFTLGDETLTRLAALAVESETGIHIHVAEDVCDEELCHAEHQTLLIDRLAAYGLLKPDSIFAHCTHLDDEAMVRASRTRLTVAHNPRSNMNNAVGYARAAAFACPVMLGTDGIGGDMLAEVRAAWFISRDVGAGMSPGDVVAMLAASARRASKSLGVELGRLRCDAAADIVITDYRPATPLTSENLAAHLIFGLSARHTRDVLIAGEWAMRNRTVERCDADAAFSNAPRVSQALWTRMAQIPCP